MEQVEPKKLSNKLKREISKSMHAHADRIEAETGERPTINEEPMEFTHPLEQGIPIKYATFHQAVNNSNNTPESMFSETTPNKARKAQMWYAPFGLVVKHEGKYIIVPHSNVIFAHVK